MLRGPPPRPSRLPPRSHVPRHLCPVQHPALLAAASPLRAPAAASPLRPVRAHGPVQPLRGQARFPLSVTPSLVASLSVPPTLWMAVWFRPCQVALLSRPLMLTLRQATAHHGQGARVSPALGMSEQACGGVLIIVFPDEPSPPRVCPFTVPCTTTGEASGVGQK